MWDGFFYRGFHIWFDPPPIPVREYDWHYQHESFDGAPDGGDHRYGHCADCAACQRDIDDMLDDDEDAA